MKSALNLGITTLDNSSPAGSFSSEELGNSDSDVPKVEKTESNSVINQKMSSMSNLASTLASESALKTGIVSDRCLSFLNRFFPGTKAQEWNDWKWQLRHTFDTVESLSKVMKLTEDEIFTINQLKKMHRLPMHVSPYYLSNIFDSKPGNALRRTMIPTSDQLVTTKNEESDPLDETGSSPVKGIVHRYPDRALFVVTQYCSSYCRYCTRSHSVGKMSSLTKKEWDAGIEYIREHKEIRDVIISGGDPLTMCNNKLEYLLSALSNIDHVEMLRLGTKIPAVLPMRINAKLINMLKKYQPLYFSLHFTHPSEFTPETIRACEMLADGGFPLGSQTVLLKGINDDPKVMMRLMHNLLKARVRPYYIYQCDPIPGSSGFRTTVEKGVDIIDHLRGFTSGYGVPQFVIDAPGGGGKIPILPDYVQKVTPEKWVLRNYCHKIYEYPEKA